MTIPTRPIALTVGVFDGLHRGHQAVVQATLEEARARGGTACVATFDPHPDTVVRGVEERPWITTPEERAALLHGMGVDRVETVRFDRETQGLRPEQFLDRILGPGAPLAALVIGEDFRMGRGRVGDRAYLEDLGRERGFAVRYVSFVTSQGGKLSSTSLRSAIREGGMDRAASIMGRPYALEGRVGSGAGRGTTLGFPTANLEVTPAKLLPASGIYLSENEVGGASHHGLTYVGSAETFGPGPLRVEVFLLRFSGSLRGEPLKTVLLSRLRADQKFGTAEELVAAMNADLERARAYWAERSAPTPPRRT